jgi:hypothetical protein
VRAWCCNRAGGAALRRETSEDSIMIEHLVETCPDDPAELKLRLDDLARQGAEVVSVLWQANRVENDQIAALEGRGSFVIVTRLESPLRARSSMDEALDRTPPL